MKIKITFKDSDSLIECIEDSLKDLKLDVLSEEELEQLKETRKEEYLEICSKWFEYQEYITVEVDTEKNTCIVLENK